MIYPQGNREIDQMLSCIFRYILPKRTLGILMPQLNYCVITCSAHTVILSRPALFSTTSTVTVSSTPFSRWLLWPISLINLALYLTLQFIPMLRSLAQASHGIAFSRLVNCTPGYILPKRQQRNCCNGNVNIAVPLGIFYPKGHRAC